LPPTLGSAKGRAPPVEIDSQAYTSLRKEWATPPIVAGILVARHLKTTDDLFDNKPSPRSEAMVAAAVQWADRIMRKIDNVFLSR